MIKNQCIVIATNDAMSQHTAIMQALIQVSFPLSVLVQFLVDVTATEDMRRSHQMQPLLMDWHSFLEDSAFLSDAAAPLLRSPAFDAAFYDLYQVISSNNAFQTVLATPSEFGVVSEFVFDGWLGLDFKLKRRLLIPGSTYNVPIEE